jgi:hypothetical protein
MRRRQRDARRELDLTPLDVKREKPDRWGRLEKPGKIRVLSDPPSSSLALLLAADQQEQTPQSSGIVSP